ncbi:RxLR effector protein [Phytophthora megakarya]|uniref:RxLR effector protein n=1 Tax=Phytophthora megakarya TaxID=4795 RepID=A0A225VGH3_9STRA|nr:RxLR effector protein [Phytophthora megakarya]
MRFYLVVLAAMVTLVTITNAITPGMESQVTKATSDVIGVAEPRGVVNRSLRLHHENQDSLDTIDNSEERAGLSASDLLSIAKSKQGVIAVELEKMNPSFQEKVLGIFREQNLSRKKLAAKLGLSSIDDTAARNYDWFLKNMEEFRVGKKPKKVPEGRIGD